MPAGPSRKARMRPTPVLRPLVALPLFASLVAADPGPDLVGTWVGEPVVNGQPGLLVYRVRPADGGTLETLIDLPTIGARDIAYGAATAEGERVRFGPQELVYDAATDTLSGRLDVAVVPGHEATVTLRRADAGPAPEPPPDQGRPAQPLWTVETDAPVFGSPLVSGGTVFIGDDSGRLWALAAEDGAEAWTFAAAGAVRARPALFAERLYVPADDGALYCLRASSGEPVWRARIGAAPSPRQRIGAPGWSYDNLTSAAVVADGSVYVGTLDGALVALDAETGAERWRARTDGAIVSTPLVAAGKAVFGSFDGKLRALDARTGAPVWTVEAGAPVTSSPTASGDLCIVGTRNYDLFGIELATGERRWSYYYWFSWVESSATVADGVAYVGSSDGARLFAVDAASGKERWVFRVLGSAWGTPAVSDELVFIGSVGVKDYLCDHRPAFHAVSRRTGRAAWVFRQERPTDGLLSGFLSSPALDDERVFVGGLDHKVYAFAQRPG